MAIFHWEGTCPSEIDLLKRSVTINSVPSVFKSLGAISSGPLGFDVFKACNWSLTSCSVIVILSREKLGRISSGNGGGFSILDIFWIYLQNACLKCVFFIFQTR